MADSDDDKQLRDRLIELGLSPGPIIDSTRELYKKKLLQLEKERRASSGNGTTAPARAATPPPAAVPGAPAVEAGVPVSRSPTYGYPPPSYQSLWTGDQSHTTESEGQPLGHSFGAQDVVDRLCMTLNNPAHMASDTVFAFADGTVYLASRAVLTSQCPELAGFLYMVGENPYPVSVVSLTGQETQVFVYPSELVADLKEKVSILRGVPVHEQRLVFQQSCLEDHYKLTACGVCAGSTVNLVLDKSNSTAPKADLINFAARSISPCFSVLHFSIKLPLNQLCEPSVHPPSPQLSRLVLPISTLHLLHIWDVPSDGFIMFIKYLYSRQLVLGNGSIGTVIVCETLAEYFKVTTLVRDSLQCIANMLTVESATKILRFAEQINSIDLKNTCSSFLLAAAHASQDN